MVGYAAGGADVAVTGVAICLSKDVEIEKIKLKLDHLLTYRTNNLPGLTVTSAAGFVRPPAVLLQSAGHTERSLGTLGFSIAGNGNRRD